MITFKDLLQARIDLDGDDALGRFSRQHVLRGPSSKIKV